MRSEARAGKERISIILIVLLHGMAGGNFPTKDLMTMHTRLGCRTYFLLPRSPDPSSDGRKFCWGMAYTKAQNRNNLCRTGVDKWFHQAHKMLTVTSWLCLRRLLLLLSVFCAMPLSEFNRNWAMH